MIKEKNIIFLLFILCFLIFSLNTVCAIEDSSNNKTIKNQNIDLSESNTPQIVQTNENNMNLTNEEKLQDNSIGTFTELNNEIKNKDQIELVKDYIFDKNTDYELKERIKINKSTIINGNGFKIDSTNLSKLFHVTSDGKLVLNNVILKSDYAKITSSAKSAQDESNIINNGKLILNNIIFTTNKNAGGTGREILGSAIYNNGEMNIENCKFINSIINSDTQYSFGLINNEGNISIKNSTFDNNKLQIISSYTVVYNGLIYNSGSLYLNNVNITNNSIKSNQPIQGLIKANNANSKINISKCLFENNSINSESGESYGTVIHTEYGTLTIANSKFIKNTGARSGGAIRTGVSSKFINNTFEKNTASANAGAIYAYGNNNIFINNIFIENTAGESGGALEITKPIQSDETYLFTNNTFINNFASKNGGAIFSDTMGTITNPVEHNIFINNKASKFGGAIYSQDGTYYIKNSIFKGNTANNGAAIYVDRTISSTLNIEQSIFDNNYAISNSGKLLIYRTSNLNYNYWGSNTPDFNKICKDIPSNIVILTIEGNEIIKTDEIYHIYFKDNETNSLIKLPTYAMNLTTNKNSIQKNVEIKNGESYFKVTIKQPGSDIIKVMTDDNEKVSFAINVDSNLPEFNINAGDVFFNDELNLEFIVKNGPQTGYVWSIYDEYNNIIESGSVNNNSKIIYSKEYPVGTYIIKIKLENIDGWINTEVNNTFKVKNAQNIKNSNDQKNPTITPQTKTTKKIKTTPKITAKKKTFKSKTKIKKYTIILKTGKKAINKAKITLKIGKKTYKATTNKKGQATFKIKKLNKKGKYKATIKYNGNNQYNKATKTIKITIK